jgi:type III restriction enzyme
MATARNIGTREFPIKFARTLTAEVNNSYKTGEMLSLVSPVTADLLRFWFGDNYCETREINFHIGQKQAILNTIYIHEVLKTRSVIDLWHTVDELILGEMGIAEIEKDKYDFRKYCIKMSTGTGKTWVMHALLIWQYLNAVYFEGGEGELKRESTLTTPSASVHPFNIEGELKRESTLTTPSASVHPFNIEGEFYTKNFLIIAPGLIVYERLLGAFLGREQPNGERNFRESDFYKFQELFIPGPYRDSVFSFLQNSVVKKEDIMKRVTGDGIVVITNWHLLMNQGVEEENEADIDEYDAVGIVKDLLPVKPGVAAGNSLETLDAKFSRGNELEFLSGLKRLLVINDEAHHVHENRVSGDNREVIWQQTLNHLSRKVGEHFIQIDFSATPYNVTGGGENRTKHYFPHIIVDFDLFTAIHQGLVKIIALDKRSELAAIPLEDLEFRAERDKAKKVISLSAGQKIMLDAGLAKLQMLEESFQELTKNDKVMKYPKMLVVCEQTSVTPLVMEYLQTHRDMADEDIVKIDSTAKNEVTEVEWQRIKQRLFDIDNLKQPRVIVSVLMLREGFDVNNICVIVPLRSSKSEILLEQIVGRGLRLMWRGRDFEECKAENRENLLKRKIEPTNYFDILSIIEHPAYVEFYKKLVERGEVIEDFSGGSRCPTGDFEPITLKDGYERYDLFFPIILQDEQEILSSPDISIESLKPYPGTRFSELKKLTQNKSSMFYSHEITVDTRFGKYRVPEEIFNADCYNAFLTKIIALITKSVDKPGKNKFPQMQINNPQIASIIDNYIRTRLFDRAFDPFEDDNWRVLMLKGVGIVDHIINQIVRVIWELQNSVSIVDAVVSQRYFSEINTIKVRAQFRVPVAKSIFEYLPYPSNKGGYERDFMIYIDNDSAVDRFIKIRENLHTFATIHYLRSDGMICPYYPDFIVKLGNEIYVVETKDNRMLENKDVIAKKISALEWCKKINKLTGENRLDCTWYYSLVPFDMFYLNRENITALEMLEMGYRLIAESRQMHMSLQDMFDEE